jgi:uncharacterized protein YfaP (DUF2135 family)
MVPMGVRFLARLVRAFALEDFGLQQAMIMKHSYATVLAAAAAWYLMVAPSTNGTMNVDAPLNQWKQSAGSYESSDECEVERKQVVAVATAVGSKAPAGKVWAMCVASDDARLKAK